MSQNALCPTLQQSWHGGDLRRLARRWIKGEEKRLNRSRTLSCFVPRKSSLAAAGSEGQRQGAAVEESGRERERNTGAQCQPLGSAANPRQVRRPHGSASNHDAC